MLLVRTHADADARSLALHRVVAEKLRTDPALLERARVRVEAWRASGAVHPHYANAWLEALSGPREELLGLLVDDGERARELRQVSPFAGVIDARTRWAVLRRVG